jgi:CheY-like chemotaxis protein
MMSSAVRENHNPQELGVDAYLTKPVKASDLVAVIRSVLGKAAVSQDVSKRPLAISSAHPARVLVAEDSVVNQELMKRLLIKWGHSVVIAGNGKIALSLLDAERFDVVLMDVQMPEINGFEATQAIRSKERGTDAHIPIIALTAHAVKGDREKCIDAGMDDYISKPIDVDKLFAAIEDATARASMSNSNGHAPAPVLDADALMLNLDGDIALLQALAEIFTTSAPTQLSDIEGAISRQDAEAIMRGAHTIKGSVATFQARAAVDAAAVLERIGDSGDLSNANIAFEELSKELKQLTQGLHEFIGRVVK